MRINTDYLKGLMGVIFNAPDHCISIDDLNDKGFYLSSDDGIFHGLLLIEYGFIANEDVDAEDMFLRLTDSGIEFAKGLEIPGTIEKLREIGYTSLPILEFAVSRLAVRYEQNKHHS